MTITTNPGTYEIVHHEGTEAGWSRIVDVPAARTIVAIHCSLCGSTDREDINPNSSYTSCCNENVVGAGQCDDTCSHEVPEMSAEEHLARILDLTDTLTRTARSLVDAQRVPGVRSALNAEHARLMETRQDAVQAALAAGHDADEIRTWIAQGERDEFPDDYYWGVLR